MSKLGAGTRSPSGLKTDGPPGGKGSPTKHEHPQAPLSSTRWTDAKYKPSANLGEALAKHQPGGSPKSYG